MGVYLVIFILLPLELFSSSEALYPMRQQQEEKLAWLAGYGEDRLSSVLITGSILCEGCLQAGSPLSISSVKGAKVAVACKIEGGRRKIMRHAKGMTDEYGDFMIELPSELHAMPKLEEECVVRILRMPRSTLCRHLSGFNSRPLKLSSAGGGVRVYSSGTVRANLHQHSHRCLAKVDAGASETQISW